MHQSLFFWALLLDILTPEDGTNTLYQIVGTKEPVPSSKGFVFFNICGSVHHAL